MRHRPSIWKHANSDVDRLGKIDTEPRDLGLTEPPVLGLKTFSERDNASLVAEPPDKIADEIVADAGSDTETTQRLAEAAREVIVDLANQIGGPRIVNQPVIALRLDRPVPKRPQHGFGHPFEINFLHRRLLVQQSAAYRS